MQHGVLVPGSWLLAPVPWPHPTLFRFCGRAFCIRRLPPAGPSIQSPSPSPPTQLTQSPFPDPRPSCGFSDSVFCIAAKLIWGFSLAVVEQLLLLLPRSGRK